MEQCRGLALAVMQRSSVAAKENLLTVVAPLLKAAAGANTQLSLDTTAAYNVGSLSASGQILCGNIGTGSTALTIQNLAGTAIAQFWNGTLLHATFNGSMAVASTVHLNGEVVVAGTLSGTAITSMLSPYATSSSLAGKENLLTVVSPLLLSLIHI